MLNKWKREKERMMMEEKKMSMITMIWHLTSNFSFQPLIPFSPGSMKFIKICPAKAILMRTS